MTEDRHVRRSGDDYAAGFANLLPRGRAWPRDEDSVLMRVVNGLAQIWGSPIDSRAADLLEIETDPRATIEMLPDWERNWGLPDPCNTEAQTLAARHAALLNKMTSIGGQSRAFFYNVAAALGYHITITEFSPFMCGLSRCGDTRTLTPTDPGDTGYRWQIGPPTIRFYWRVHVYGVSLKWFRTGGNGGQTGVDPMVRIGLATDLECLLRRWKPAQTDIVFSFLDSAPSWAEYRWFRTGGGGGHAGGDHMFQVIEHAS